MCAGWRSRERRCWERSDRVAWFRDREGGHGARLMVSHWGICLVQQLTCILFE